MSVLMINPNRYRPHVSPIGLEYVCNSLLRENIEFDVADLNFVRESVIYSKLIKNNVDIVGITVRNIDSVLLASKKFFIPGIKSLVERIKDTKDCKVVLGGGGFSILPREVLEYTGADFGVAGYGEEALPELVRVIREGGSLAKIDNLVWRKNGKFQVNPRSTGDYENIPVRHRNIIRNGSYNRVYGIGNIETTRGCSRRCGYCIIPGTNGCKVVTRKIANVIEELKELKSMGIYHVYFCDSEFNNCSQRYLFQLFEKLAQNKLGVTWSANMHPDPKTISLRLLTQMREAGCREIILSADSGSEEILEGMGKQHTAEDTVKCVEIIRKANIRISPAYLVGWPGETTKTIEETFTQIRRCQFDGAVVFAGVRIYPDTKLAQIAVDEGYIPGDANLLEPIFYQPERVLHEFMPLVRSHAKKLSNCIYPLSSVDFMNLFIRNVYMRGGFISRGFADFFDYVNSISWQEKLKILGKTALDYAFPFRSRFIPNAEAKW